MVEEVNDKVEQMSINDSVTEDIVDPWSVKASSNKGIDYEKLIGKLHIFVLFYTSNYIYKYILNS